MSIKSTITKLLSGGEPDALEREELENFDPEKLLAELSELRAKSDADEREKLSERERLELDIAALSSERDQLKLAHDALIRSQKVRDLAAVSNFADADYLDYLAAKEQLDFSDAQACEKFITKLRGSKPEAFISTLRSGSGTPAASNGRQSFCTSSADPISRIITDLENIM